LPADFFIKSTGMGHANISLLARIPYPQFDIMLQPAARVRSLLLVCLTSAYSSLWTNVFSDTFCSDNWTKLDQRLSSVQFGQLRRDWAWSTPLRSDFARRQALVELDVLVCMALGLTVDELKAIWRVQFPIARQYEAETFYDSRGKIVFTPSRGLVGVGLPRHDWDQVKQLPTGETVSRTIVDDTQPGGPRERTITYVAPFDRCDREADYEIAWAEFERRRNGARAEAAQ